MSIKVLIVDDHALVRTGFKLILGREVDIEVVGEAESGEEALPQIRRLKPDVVLCDLHLPGISGLEVTERVVRGDYGTRVIAVSVLEEVCVATVSGQGPDGYREALERLKAAL